MSLTKQAKVLNRNQIEMIHIHLGNGRNGLRNQLIFLLSVKAGLRAKEIAGLTWAMVMDSDGELARTINLTDVATKGASGRTVPLNKYLRADLLRHFEVQRIKRGFDSKTKVIQTERSETTSAQAIVNMFSAWYSRYGLFGCSSHSGRRTFITNAARKISTVGGSLRDVQYLAGHSSLQTTERYIEVSSHARKKIVDIV